ncbi:MAG: amidohydrolase family protein [Alphaproteobacteria bacterium]|nr:amidohydrolase family protein [Alphaproteobacteria bacterium]MCB9930966.1 amidohydrolase family protein [Alphaproteobacteria bacterium]
MSSSTSTVASRAGVNEEWLARRAEEVLEPDLPICDPHHHLWDFPAHRYLLDQLLADIGDGHNVRSTVFIECTAFYRADGPENLRLVGETEFVNGTAAMAASGRYGASRPCSAIVGCALLNQGAAVEEVLQAHVAAGNGRFRGVRHSAAWDAHDEIHNGHTNPPRGLYLDAKFREGFGVLQRMGLTFDAWLYHPQLPEVAALAAAFPDAKIVLDHCGGPLGIGPYAGKQDAYFAQWQKDIRAIAAASENVYVKVGGIGMKVNGHGFHDLPEPPSSERLAEVWRPYMETCIEAFGPKRSMFESNFPVDKVSGSYRTYWNAFKRVASGASAEEKRWLFHDAAATFYGLETLGR